MIDESFLNPSVHRNAVPPCAIKETQFPGGPLRENRIGILLSIRSKAQRDVLRQCIEAQPHLEVCGEAVDPIELLLAVEPTEADVAILSQTVDGQVPGIASHLLSQFAGLAVLVISPEGRKATLLRQQICQRDFDDLDPESIIGLIRMGEEEG